MDRLLRCSYADGAGLLLEGPSFVFINIARLSSLLNNLVLGGLAAAGGYLTASVLTPLISHHALDCKGICAKNCGAIDPLCTSAKVQCTCGGGPAAGILAPITAVKQVTTNPSEASKQLLGGSPAGKTPSGAPDTGPDADCDPWGVLKGLCVAGKSFLKGGQAASGAIGAPCIPGLPVPCAVVVLGGAILGFALLKGKI